MRLFHKSLRALLSVVCAFSLMVPLPAFADQQESATAAAQRIAYVYAVPDQEDARATMVMIGLEDETFAVASAQLSFGDSVVDALACGTGAVGFSLSEQQYQAFASGAFRVKAVSAAGETVLLNSELDALQQVRDTQSVEAALSVEADVSQIMVTLDENNTLTSSALDVSGAPDGASLLNEAEPLAGGVIALDPGHGGYDSGACWGDLQEKDLNWAYTMACKERLEAYGYTVYVTRTENECPGLTERVVRAVNAGAIMFACLHTNAAENTSAHGCEVWVQVDSSYNYATTHVVDVDIANRILANLTALGLYNRGVQQRYSSNGSTYPDGSTADYYTVLEAAREYNLPAFIVEHAFVAGDYEFLYSAENLRNCGYADADGIASYLGGIAPACDQFYSSNRNDFYGTFRMWATGVMPSNAEVLIPVWPANVTDASQIIFYPAIKDANGNFFVDVSASDYDGYTGVYNADCYVRIGSSLTKVAGTIQVSLGSSSASVSKPSASVVSTSVANAPADLTGVRYAVWLEAGDRSDLMWVDAAGADAAWEYDFSQANLSVAGAYAVHAYGVLADGSMVFMGATTLEVEGPSASVSVRNYDPQAGTYQVVVANLTSPFGVSSVQVPTWSAADQSDLVWYNAALQADGTYVANITYSTRESARTRISDAYVVGTNGLYYCLGRVMQETESCVSVHAWAESSAVGMKVSGLGNFDGTVQFAVWSEANGQDDLVWLDGGLFGSDWVAGDALSTHAFQGGSYQVHAYANTGGAMTFLGATTVQVSGLSATVSAWDEGSVLGCKAAGLGNFGGRVQFAVWSEANGQDDLVWLDGG
ncbi:MAG: GBS Bsp-like repeat-containing protein, partial [Coriobacteriia bacterium]|nr:GBS Bsp-like repeat-containing protein [Coriobacteriia bacterium]